MGIRQNLSNRITTKVGQKAFKIEDIKEKNAMPTTQDELARCRERAEAIVKRKSLMSSTASVVPIPGLDFGVDIKLMRDIIEDVNKLYGLDHKQVNTLGDDLRERILLRLLFKVVNSSAKKYQVLCLKLLLRTWLSEQLPNKRDGFH